jgi:hypothetical protein
MNTQRMIIVLLALAAVGLGLLRYMYDGTADGAATEPAAEAQEAAVTTVPQGPVARIAEEELADGFVPLIGEWENGGFNKHGWNHYGPGWFTLDHETGILASHGGMGLLWYSAEMFGDFVLRLEFNTSVPDSNSGIFLRVPEMVTSDEYIYHSFEVQIHATAPEAVHRTGAVYDAEAPSEDRAKAPGEWNEMEISFVGDRITVSLNGAVVTDWVAEPRGKIRDFAPRGYIGLQNHDWETSVYFRNIRVKKLD